MEKECSKCGVDRNILIKARVRIQSEGLNFEYKWLCISCFLKMFHFFNPTNFTIDMKSIATILAKVVHTAIFVGEDK